MKPLLQQARKKLKCLTIIFVNSQHFQMKNINRFQTYQMLTQSYQNSPSLLKMSRTRSPLWILQRHCRLIREVAPVLAAPLSVYFTNLLRQSVFPSAWKLANVTPIFKKGDPSNTANYRPISLLCCLGKLMERCVHKVIYNYFVSDNLLTPLQSGFIKGDSTIN